MPDNPMQGLRDVFAETRPLDDEPSDAGRTASGLGGLSRLTTALSVTETNEQSIAITTAPAVEATATDYATGPSVAPRRPGAIAPRVRHKTSISISARLRSRVSSAYRRDRWTAAELVEEIAERLRSRRITASDVERALRGLGSEPVMTIQKVAIALDDLEILDDVATQLRLSRSQLLAATLTLVLDSLP